MARFIVVDITDPKSIPQELASIVPHRPSVPAQPVLQSGYEPWGMYAIHQTIKRYGWVLPLVFYPGPRGTIERAAPKGDCSRRRKSQRADPKIAEVIVRTVNTQWQKPGTPARLLPWFAKGKLN
jgi:hypothetical protein